MVSNNVVSSILLILSIFVLSNCSVYKAASNEGVSVSDVSKCKKRGCFLSIGMNIVDSHQDSDGKFKETYRGQARKSGVNYFRAAGHGVLDVATLGLWEVVGTPIEGAVSNNLGYITAIATYEHKDALEVEKVEIYDANGNTIKKRT